MRKIKEYCCLCREPIYDSIEPDRAVECGMCVQKRVKHIERMELESGMSIKNRVDYGIARKMAENSPTSPTHKRRKVPQRGCNRVKTAKFVPNLQNADRKELPMCWEDLL